MTNKESNPILTSVYGKDAPDAAKFGKGARSIEQIKQATDAQRKLSRDPAPRRDSR